MTLLVGGPQNGLVALTSGLVPALLLSEPRPPSLLDELQPTAIAEWCPSCRWYEA